MGFLCQVCFLQVAMLLQEISLHLRDFGTIAAFCRFLPLYNPVTVEAPFSTGMGMWLALLFQSLTRLQPEIFRKTSTSLSGLLSLSLFSTFSALSTWKAQRQNLCPRLP